MTVLSLVTPIGTANLKEIPNNLRRLADEIEKGCEQSCGTVLVVLGDRDGNVTVRGFGDHASPLEAAGWLSRAQTGLTTGYQVV